jgi:putative tryptophan/tyrosine transport system substrate-binding protein
MRRIALALVLVLSFVAPSAGVAQQSSKIHRVGWLEVCGPGPRRPHFDIFRVRLAEQGYVEGKNLIVEQRFADCRYDRMPGLAADSCRFRLMSSSQWAHGRLESSRQQ